MYLKTRADTPFGGEFHSKDVVWKQAAVLLSLTDMRFTSYCKTDK